METIDLFAVIAALNRRGLGPVPAEITDSYKLLTWLVDKQLLPADLLQRSEISPEELAKFLIEYRRISSEDLQRPIYTHTAAPQRWRLGYAAARAPFADFAQTERMLEALHELAGRGPIRVRFSNFTGMVRTLRGDLWSEVASDTESMSQVGEHFLDTYGGRLFGGEKILWVRETAQVIGNVARFQQVGAGEVPLYGAKINLGFNDSGRLTMINSSWLPYAFANDVTPEPAVSWDKAVALAYDFIGQRFPLEKPAAFFSVNSVNGRTLYPFVDLEGRALLDLPANGGAYRPAWTVWVVDEARIFSWEVVVDEENGQILNPTTTPLTAGLPLQLCVLKDNQAALNNTVTQPTIETLPRVTYAAGFLPFPTNCGVPNPPINQLRSGNVYYHLRQAADSFTEIRKAAWPPAQYVSSIELPGLDRNLTIRLEVNSQVVGLYTPFTATTPRTLQLSDGSAPLIGDAMLDCEVIYHEYAHATFDAVQPDLFSITSPELFREALNEGLAFYFAVSLSQRIGGEAEDKPNAPAIRWGEAAYKSSAWTDKGWRDLQHDGTTSQRPNHDFFQLYHLFPQYIGSDNADPAGAGDQYSCGMAWARILWDVRRLLGPQIADAVILRALNITGGIQTELETPAEAILHYASEHIPGRNYEDLLQLLFCQRGIMADTPINALHSFARQGFTYLVAATEGKNTAGVAGCMIISDKDNIWHSLGQSGLDDVTALASVQVSDGVGGERLLIFAAGEHWPQPGKKPTRAIYQYEVTTAEPNLLGAWQPLAVQISDNPLAQMQENPDVNTLTAANIPGQPGHFWLFAGAEQGLHIYDSRTNTWQADSLTERIIATCYQEQPQPRIFASTNKNSLQLFVYMGDQVGWKQKFIKSTNRPAGTRFLTLHPGPTTASFIWVGTSAGEIYQVDPATGWTFTANVQEAIFSLWVDYTAIGEPIFYAGTNKGVIRAGSPQNLSPLPATSLSGETLAYTTVLAAQRVGNKLWFGTAQRGLWQYTQSANGAAQWSRQVAGFPRVGPLIAAIVPADASPVSLQFSAALQPGQLATHLLYLPAQTMFTNLELTNFPEDTLLQLFYLAPYVDLATQNWAGLQPQTLVGGILQGPVRHGFYLLAVRSNQFTGTYQITLTVKN